MQFNILLDTYIIILIINIIITCYKVTSDLQHA